MQLRPMITPGDRRAGFGDNQLLKMARAMPFVRIDLNKSSSTKLKDDQRSCL